MARLMNTNVEKKEKWGQLKQEKEEKDTIDPATGQPRFKPVISKQCPENYDKNQSNVFDTLYEKGLEKKEAD